MANVLWPILRQILRHPRRTAVVDDQRTWRYLDLLGGAFHLARQIKRMTDRPHVGILLPTSGAFPMALLACWMLRRTAVPINFLLGERERQYIIDNSEVDVVVTVGPMLDFIGGRPQGVKLIELEKMDFRGLPPVRWPARARGDELAVILYTSGTSGKPKGVMLTHANLRFDVEAAVRHAGLKSADCFLGVLPQFHSFGLTGLTILPLTIGAKVVYTARFIPRKVVNLFRKHQPDIFLAIPSMYNALMTAKDAKPEDFQCLRLAISGGEPLPRDVRDRFEQRFGVEITEGYGLTETSPVAALNTPTEHRRDSVGKLLPGTQGRIVTEEGHAVEAGDEGEIQLAGPHIMAGYYKMPELTDDVIDREGFFTTGDWGRLDEDGYLYITGRKKEMLIISGENVFPREIEEVINSHPSVHESAVIGKADPMRGEVPIAYVELEEDAEFDEKALREFCRERIAPWKAPREYHVVEKLPRGPTGKVLRRALQGES